jgi:isopentenyl phosphate kinase
MNKKLILIKLGGGLITDKEKPFTVKMEIIADLSRQIKEALNEDKNLNLIIGNGGGSFPHYLAIQYQMNNGINNEEQKYGFCAVQDAAARLNRIVVAELLKAGVRAISVNPSSMIVAKEGKIKELFIKPIIEMINLGIVPVLYGDIVIDKKIGAKIFSTERLLAEIALRLQKSKVKVDRVIQNGLTKGVLDKNGNVIALINRKNFKTFKKVFYQTKGYDVTGGMSHKVKECLNLSRYKIKSLIINGALRQNLLKRAILGERVTGTVIE